MPNLLDILDAGGITYDNGGCWRVLGGRNSTFGAYSAPIDLEVGGVLSSYSLADILPGGDDPNITDWVCDFRYIGLLYGCTSSVPGCICPGGVCVDSAIYIFDTDGCCCVLPCSGDFVECTYSTDFGSTISLPTSNAYFVTSFILDGVQYITTPVQLLPPNVINIGGQNYNTSFSDTINSIGVPNFTSPYPSLAQILSAQAQGTSIDTRNNIVRLKHPSCLSFSITVSNGTDVNTFSNSGYTGPFTSPNYVVNTPFDCINTNEC